MFTELGSIKWVDTTVHGLVQDLDVLWYYGFTFGGQLCFGFGLTVEVRLYFPLLDLGLDAEGLNQLLV